MRFSLTSLFATCLVLSACGGEESAPAPDGQTGADASAMTSAGLPDPCGMLTEAVATELLQARELAQENLQNEKIVSRVCIYRAPGEGEDGKMLLMSLSLFGEGTMNSATDSREALVEKSSRLAGGLAPSAVRDDIGNLAIVFDQGSATRLQVMTGIGNAGGGADIVSELQIGYVINRDDLAPDKRQALLAQLALGHLNLLLSSMQ